MEPRIGDRAQISIDFTSSINIAFLQLCKCFPNPKLIKVTVLAPLIGLNILFQSVFPECSALGVPPPSRRIVPLVRPAGRSPASQSETTGLTTPGELSHGQTARLAAAPAEAPRLAGETGCGETDCGETG